LNGILHAELATVEGRLADARSAVLNGLAAMASSIDPALIVELCTVGMTAEAAVAERARALRSSAEHDGAMLRAAALQRQAEAAISANGIETTPTFAAELRTAEAEWTRIVGPSDPNRWSDAANAWEQIEYPYQLAYTRWRQAEALVTAGASRDQAEAAANAGWLAATKIGARRLTAELESLARRARLTLHNPAIRGDHTEDPLPDAATQFQLTNRERQVLTLLADGRSNRQIAETLYISEKTASVHVSHILAKLGVTNRGEAAAVAHRLALT
jgi:DNA-binding NarL/FixJ family response regulator